MTRVVEPGRWQPVWRVAALMLLGLLQGAPAVSAAIPVDYTRDVKSLLRERCYACHGALKRSGGLRLDTASSLRSGGDGGPAVVPGHAESSLLIERVSDPDPATRMPPEGPPLSSEQVDRLRAWVNAGAPAPAVEAPERDPREHWAFRAPSRPPTPRTKNPGWILNPIDAFLAAEHDRRGLTPAPEADRALLLRRVTLDLTGLPPTRDEIHAFLDDRAPDAYERLVERLLQSPRYGERWGRHWMDVWRYADWYGRREVPDVWNSAPQIWRWRDWIVRSLNADKGYDRMVAEMFAADEIAPTDDSAAVATGYLIRNWYALNPNQWMRDNVEHTGKAFLALTFNCAHCHDHKYDPIRQVDYFRLRAFFEPIAIRQDRVPGEADPGPFQEYNYSTLRKIVRTGAVRIFDRSPDAPTWFYTGGDERNRVKERGPVAPGVPEFLGGSAPKPSVVQLPLEAFRPGLRPIILEEDRALHRAAVRQAEDALATIRAPDSADLMARRAELDRAAAALEVALRQSERSTGPLALEGRQSLILDATTGRRILNNRLDRLKGLDDGTVLSFLLRIEKDGHVNVQLARDVEKGLTAGYVAFESGQVRAYRPGGFEEFVVGSYSPEVASAGLRVEVRLVPSQDRGYLTIGPLRGGNPLVESIPVALNGWDPSKHPRQAVSLDAHTGTVAVFDALRIAPKSAGGPVEIDFEAPRYSLDEDVVGRDGWSSSSFSKPPAHSVVGFLSAPAPVREALGRLVVARGADEAPSRILEASRARLAAAKARLEGLESRIAAERAAQGGSTGKPVEDLVLAAGRIERLANLAEAEASWAEAVRSLREAEATPPASPGRAAAIQKARDRCAAASNALENARASIREPGGPAKYTPLSPTYPATSTGRRRALAAWLTSRENPLTARVAINHIWMRHFGSPIVATVFDFGRNGARPTHPELLDWLAVELMESGWSMKHIHRLIVTSRAYRMSSAEGAATENRARDRANDALWRMNPGRLEAEAVRDSLLAAAEALDSSVGGQELENTAALTTRRRSLYYACYPESGGKSELGAIFDAPDSLDCYRRTRSVVPQQALALTNTALVHDLSRKLAEAATRSSPDPPAFVAEVYERILARRPSSAERAACLEFLARRVESLRREKGPEPEFRARAGLVRAIFSHNDFLTVR